MKAPMLASMAGLVALAASLISAAPSGGEAREEPPGEAAPADPMLEQALRHGPAALMFGSHERSKIHPHSELVVTSARDADGRPQKVYVRNGTVRVFRVDASLDDFTATGGWYWRARGVEGKTRFEPRRPEAGGLNHTPPKAGPLVLVIYHSDGTVDWYSLHYDLRC